LKASTLDVAKEARDIMSANRTYSNRRDKKNKYSGGQKSPAKVRRQRRGNDEKSLCNGCE